jgi:general secretion pathway protein J
MTGRNSIGSGDGQSGVTLVEIVVALAVIALTLAVAAGGLRLLARSGDRGAQVIARHDVLSRGIDVLRRDIERLERAVRKRRTPEGPVSEFIFRGDASGLTLVVVEPPFPSESGPYFVVYSILQRPDGAVLTRERAQFQASADDLRRLRTVDPVAVIEGPYRLRFLYLDRKDERERWLTQWSDPRSLPDLISLEISSLTEGIAAMPPITFRPRVDAERSCVKEDASSCTIGTQGTLAPETGPGGRN